MFIALYFVYYIYLIYDVYSRLLRKKICQSNYSVSILKYIFTENNISYAFICIPITKYFIYCPPFLFYINIILHSTKVVCGTKVLVCLLGKFQIGCMRGCLFLYFVNFFWKWFWKVDRFQMQLINAYKKKLLWKYFVSKLFTWFCL